MYSTDSMTLFSKKPNLPQCLDKVSAIFGADYVIDIDKNAKKCFLIAWIFLNGFDQQEDWILAKHFLEKAVKLGDYKAGFNLGLLITEGILGEGNLGEGLEYVKASAEQGYGKAYSTLGFYFEKGIGVTQNTKTAEEYYHKAIACGHTVAACNLAYLYLFDKTYQQNLKEKLPLTMRYLTEGEKNAHPGSIYILGRIYHLGCLDDKPNIEKAIECYKIAAKLNHRPSIETLLSIYSTPSIVSSLIPKPQNLPHEIITLQAQLATLQTNSLSAIAKYRLHQAQITVGGYEFRNSWSFISAITRSGYIKDRYAQYLISSEHLEWEGDAMLSLAIRSELIALYSTKSRGDLNTIYQNYVKNSDENQFNGGPLYRIAKRLQLEPLLLMSESDTLRSYRRRGKHDKKHTVEMQLSNHVEMLIGAIVHDGAVESAREFILQQFRHLGLNVNQQVDESYGFSDDESLDSRIRPKM